jgi:RNA polymerase primary sigma factor
MADINHQHYVIGFYTLLTGDKTYSAKFNNDAPLPNKTLNKLEKVVLSKINEIGLSFREREIIKLRYSLKADCNGKKYPYTLEEVGKIFDVTRERIRQLEKEAFKKLQDYYLTNFK